MAALPGRPVAAQSRGMPAVSPCVTHSPCSDRRHQFWIVSSRNCPQHGKGRCPACRFDHFLVDNGRCYRQSGPDAFRRWLIPGAPIAIVVHGSFTGFRSLLTEGIELSRWLHAAAPQRPLNIVIYTWPSDEYPTKFFPIDINILGRESAFNGIYLAQFFAAIPRGSRVCLVGHSHGARTVAAFLHLQSGGAVQGFRLCHPQPCSWRFRALFLAAAIDHDWLDPGERYGLALCSAEALLNLRNRCDLPLVFYPLHRPFAGRALARAGFTRRDRYRLGSWNAKIAELDVTRSLGTHHLWVHYFRRLELAPCIAPWVHFTDDDLRQRAQPGQPPPGKQTGRSQRPLRRTSSGIRRTSARMR